MQSVDRKRADEMILAIQEQVRGKPPPDELIALDGKEPKHGGGQGVLSAVSLPGLHYLGSEIVETKTNEIPVSNQMLEQLEVEGRWVSLDALNTQQEISRSIVLEGGGDYLLTVKGNQPTPLSWNRPLWTARQKSRCCPQSICGQPKNGLTIDYRLRRSLPPLVSRLVPKQYPGGPGEPVAVCPFDFLPTV